MNVTRVKETDTTHDPLYNGNEITRVRDILELHKRGINVGSFGIKNEIIDSRSDAQKLASPLKESDKLFPSFARLVAENAHYSKVLQQNEDKYKRWLDMLNDAEGDSSDTLTPSTPEE